MTASSIAGSTRFDVQQAIARQIIAVIAIGAGHVRQRLVLGEVAAQVLDETGRVPAPLRTSGLVPGGPCFEVTAWWA